MFLIIYFLEKKWLILFASLNIIQFTSFGQTFSHKSSERQNKNKLLKPITYEGNRSYETDNISDKNSEYPDFSIHGKITGIKNHVQNVTLSVFNQYFRSRHKLDAIDVKKTVERGRFLTSYSGITNGLAYMILQFDSLNIDQLYGFFLVEKKDNILIDINKDNIQFSGEGADKYNCQIELNKCSYDDLSSEFKSIDKKIDYSNTYQRLARQSEILDSIDALKKNVIKKYSFRLSPDIRNILIADAYAKNKMELFRYFLLSSTTEKSEREMLFKFYQNYIKPLPEDTTNSSLLHRSALYTDYLFQLRRIKFILENKYVENGARLVDINPTFENFFAFINTHYGGPLKDKLIATLFSESYTLGQFKGADTFSFKAIHSMKYEPYKKIVEDISHSKTRGAKAFNFELIDSTGKTIQLSDFRGKVIVVDFWFTGCKACIDLAKNMLPVYKHFQDKSDVVFVSISVDEKINRWKQSLKSGIYTHLENIVLYTNGLGIKHPLVRFYQLIGFPQLMLIDKEGKILDSNPVVPTAWKGSENELIDTIESYLKAQVLHKQK